MSVNNSHWASVIDNEILTHLNDAYYLKNIQQCLVAKAAFVNLMLEKSEFKSQINNDPRTQRMISQVQ